MLDIAYVGRFIKYMHVNEADGITYVQLIAATRSQISVPS